MVVHVSYRSALLARLDLDQLSVQRIPAKWSSSSIELKYCVDGNRLWVQS